MGQGKVKIDIVAENEELKKALKESTGLMRKFKTIAIAAFVAVGAAKLVGKIFQIGKTLQGLYATQAAAETKLRSVIEATGGAAGFSADQMKRMAASLQEQIAVGDEAIINTQALLATFKNIRGDVFKEATEAVYDMSAVLGNDAKSGAIQLGKALNDPIKGVSALTEVGVSFSEMQKEQIEDFVRAGDVMGAQKVILNELKSEFGGAAEAAGNTLGGQVQKLKNTLGDLGEQIFALVIPAMSTLVQWLGHGVVFIQNLTQKMLESSGGFVQFVEGGVNFLISGFQNMMDGGIFAFTVLQTVIRNWSDLSITIVGAFTLTVIGYYSTVQHWLTVVIPEALLYLYDNWRNIFTDIASLTATVVTNMWNNLLGFIESVKGLFSGEGFQFEWTNLTEGFESSLTKLPEIAKRRKSELELALELVVGDAANRLATSFDRNLEKNKAVFGGLLEKQESDNDKIVADQEKVSAEFAVTAAKEKKARKGAASKDQTGQTVGLEQLAADIQKAASGGNIQEEIAGNMAETRDAVKVLPEKIAAANRQNETVDHLASIHEMLSTIMGSMKIVPENVIASTGHLEAIKQSLPISPVI